MVLKFRLTKPQALFIEPKNLLNTKNITNNTIKKRPSKLV